MSSMHAPGLARRPVVFVEDHLYHTTELLDAIASTRPDLLGQITVCALARPGPDTDAEIRAWAERFPPLQVLDLGRLSSPDQDPRREWRGAPDLAQPIAGVLRPGGILVQDIQLSTVPFIPPDRWWESIYIAATVRGLFADRVPTVRFLSNKRGYTATFGRDLLEAGFDPRDVMDKSDLRPTVVPTIISLFDRRFPFTITASRPPAPVETWPVMDDVTEQRELETAFDVLLWRGPEGLELGGTAVARASADARVRVKIKGGSHEGQTWLALAEDRLSGGAGLPVIGVGERIGPPDAGRAELTNLAARHIHTLRGRLTDAGALLTIDHAYRFADRLRVGVCRDRDRVSS